MSNRLRQSEIVRTIEELVSSVCHGQRSPVFKSSCLTCVSNILIFNFMVWISTCFCFKSLQSLFCVVHRFERCSVFLVYLQHFYYSEFHSIRPHFLHLREIEHCSGQECASERTLWNEWAHHKPHKLPNSPGTSRLHSHGSNQNSCSPDSPLGASVASSHHSGSSPRNRSEGAVSPINFSSNV